MSASLIFSNIHLGLELFGAIIFFIVAWLFFEAYLIKKDLFSLGRTIGFSLLILWQILHALGGESSLYLISSFIIYSAGLLIIFLTYWFEKLPPKPKLTGEILALVALNFNLVSNFYVIPLIFLILISFALIRRYFKNIDRLLKWMAIAFIILAASSIVSFFSGNELASPLWIVEHALRLIAFIIMVFWVWLFLSLRLKEETLIIFISVSLFISLLVTTTFSIFLLQQTQQEEQKNLAANAKILDFYIDGLKSKSLAASQIIVNNNDFISSVKARDVNGLEKVGDSLISSTGQQFLTIASNNGRIFSKINFPIVKGENILTERIGAEAMEGRTAVTVDQSPVEGLTVRAAAPIISQGEIIGMIITGFLLDKNFVNDFKKVSGLETTIFNNKKVVASTILPPDQIIDIPQGEFLGVTNFLGQEVIGNFQPLKNLDGKVVGTVSLTTTPGELLKNNQSTNRLTLLIVFLISIGLIVPLYRFTVFLTS